jgi:hypothetical protein
MPDIHKDRLPSTMTRLLTLVPILVCSLDCSKGGGSDGVSLSGPNVVAAVVDRGPPTLAQSYTNGLFVTLTLCAPETSNCQTIDHMLVDTGSVGVRVLESELTLALPAAVDANGLALAECTQFVDGAAWGPLKISDVEVGGESAQALPIQVLGEGTYPMPTGCTGTPITDLNSLGANGILGVGVHLTDCDTACAQPLSAPMLNPGLYYACSSALADGCNIASVPVDHQVSNPVAAFPDNNGVMIQLPSVPASGASSVSGQLVFGIGTQANNGLGGAIVLALDAAGYLQTSFPVGGTTKYASILDSGSNALLFLDSTTTNLAPCPEKGLSSFYCPDSTANVNAAVLGSDGSSALVHFSVANASKLDGRSCAFSNLAGPMPGYSGADSQPPSFDWGLPFFFGRSVYTAIEGQPTPAVVGPYFAF